MKIFLKISLSVLFLFTSLFAQNYSDALRLSQPGLYSGARALGMGNSYVALSNDFSAVYFNPAGLGLIHDYQINGSFNHNALNNSTAFFNSFTESKQNSTAFKEIGFVFPIPTYRGSLVFAFGYSKVKDFNGISGFQGFNNGSNSFAQLLADSDGDNYAYELGLAYYDSTNGWYNTLLNGKLQQIGRIVEKGSLNQWAFSGAMEVAKDVFLGASVNVISGRYTHDRDFAEIDSKNFYGATDPLDPGDMRTADFLRYDYHDIFDWDISGWDMNIGFLYKMDETAKIGANIKFPSKMTVKEQYIIEATSDFATDGFFLDPPVVSEVEYEISTPFEFSAGASAEVAGLVLSGQAKFIDYTEMEFVSGLDRSLISYNNKDINTLFRSVVNYNLGVEYKIPVVDLKLRGGFMYQPSPYDEDPTEYDHKFITTGLGYEAGNAVAIDAAFVKGWWKDFADNYGAGESRTFQDLNRNNFVIGFRYKF